MNFKQAAEDIEAMHHQLQEALSMRSKAIEPFAKQLQHYIRELDDQLTKVITESE